MLDGQLIHDLHLELKITSLIFYKSTLRTFLFALRCICILLAKNIFGESNERIYLALDGHGRHQKSSCAPHSEPPVSHSCTTFPHAIGTYWPSSRDYFLYWAIA